MIYSEYYQYYKGPSLIKATLNETENITELIQNFMVRIMIGMVNYGHIKIFLKIIVEEINYIVNLKIKKRECIGFKELLIKKKNILTYHYIHQ